MYDVIFTKYSYNRDRRFQCKTSISKQSDLKIVEKSSLYPEGESHIENILKRFKNLKEIYKNSLIDVAECNKITDGKVAFSFIEGNSLEDILDGYLDKNNIDGLISEIQAYFDEIVKAKTYGDFEVSQEFIDVFGNLQFPKNCKGISKANLDAIFSNVKKYNDKYIFIDYEWGFDFQIPVDYLKYRCIFWYINSQTRITKIDKHQLYDIFHLVELKDTFEIMESNYQNFVMGDYIAEWKIMPFMNTHTYHLADIENMKKVLNQNFQIYEYSESNLEKSYFVNSVDHELDNSFDLSLRIPTDTKKLRIDPTNQCCILYIKHLKGDVKEIIFEHNGYALQDNIIVYDTMDPMLLFPCDNLDKVDFKGICIPLSIDMCKSLIEVKNHINEVNHTLVDYSNGILELREAIDRLQGHIENEKNKYENMLKEKCELIEQLEYSIKQLDDKVKKKDNEIEKNEIIIQEKTQKLQRITHSKYFKLIAWHFKDIL